MAGLICYGSVVACIALFATGHALPATGILGVLVGLPLIAILLKAVGIGILSEITCMICTDSGNAALGKVIQFLTSAVILWLCIPLFTQLIELIEGVLGAV